MPMSSVLQALLERLDALVHRRRLHEDFRRPAPDHHHAVNRFLEGLNVGDQLVGQILLVLARLYVCAVQALHIVLVEHRRQRLDRLQVRLQLRQRLFIQHLGMRGRLVNIVLEDVPTGEHNIVQIGQRNKVLDQWRFVVRALAQPDRAHLRKRPNRLGQSAADGLHSGNHRCGYGAQADNHYPKFPLRGRNLRRIGGLLTALPFS
jgi:hypothetical protein